MRIYVVFSDPNLKPIYFEVGSEGQAGEDQAGGILARIFPAQYRDDFENVEFAIPEDELEKTLQDYKECTGHAVANNSFLYAAAPVNFQLKCDHCKTQPEVCKRSKTCKTLNLDPNATLPEKSQVIGSWTLQYYYNPQTDKWRFMPKELDGTGLMSPDYPTFENVVDAGVTWALNQ